ncbi:MAG: ArnT family glycosyltransferase [Planctomycetota bacterium]
MIEHSGDGSSTESKALTAFGYGSLMSILLLVLAAGVAWGVSVVLPCDHPIGRIASLANWLAFGLRILRDTLQAVSILALAVLVSMFVPGIGLWIERIVFQSKRRVFLVVTAIMAILSSALFNYIVFEQFPNIIDEMVMVFQSRLLAEGRLFAQTPEMPDFFDLEFIVADGPRWYGKYFIGPSLILVPSIWLGGTWLVSPILGGAATCLVYFIGRHLLNEKIARVATVLMIISPFRIVIFATVMAHPSCLVALSLFTLGVIKVVKDPARFWWAMIAGASLGFAMNCRPLTALAMGTVISLIGLYTMSWRRLRWQTAVAFIMPLLLFAVVFFAYNKALTHDALLPPFNKWSPSDRLGFGPDIGLEYWPEADRGYTIRKALYKNTFYNIEGLGIHLLGWRHVTLLLLLLSILRSPWPKQTWSLAAVVIGLMVAYFFYVTHAVLGGQPRYWSESMPMMLILAAVALVHIRRWLPMICRWLNITPAIRTGRAACWLAGVAVAVWGMPTSYGMVFGSLDFCFEMRGQRHRIHETATKAGLDNALVLVKTGYYRRYKKSIELDMYGYVFMHNDPDLTGPVLYARDLGERNTELLAYYPQRKAYRYNGNVFGFGGELEPVSLSDFKETNTHPASNPQ